MDNGTLSKSRPVRPFALARAAVLLLAAPLLAGAADSPAARTQITLGYLPSNAFLAAFVAKDHGFFAKRGLDVSFDLLPNGVLLRQALAQGGVQVGTMTPPAVLRSDDRGVTLQIVAAAALQSHDHPTAGIVAGQRSNIHSAADFPGKKVGVPGLHGLNHIVFMKWLQDHAIDPQRVQFVSVVLPQMAEKLKAGEVDAVLPVEPFLETILQNGSGYLVSTLPGEVAKSYIQALYAAPRAWAQSNPEAVRAFRDGLREGVRWIADNEEAARKSQMRYLKISERSAMSAPLPEFVTDISAADVQFWMTLCRQLGVTRTSQPVADVLGE